MGGVTVVILVIALILYWVFHLNIWVSAIIAVILGPLLMAVFMSLFGRKGQPGAEAIPKTSAPTAGEGASEPTAEDPSPQPITDQVEPAGQAGVSGQSSDTEKHSP